MPQYPALDIDRRRRERGTEVSKRGRTERRIVWALLQHLRHHGFHPQSVDSGPYGGPEKTRSMRAVMENVFNLDDSWVEFRRGREGRPHHVLLIQGNGDCILSDWSYSREDADGFNRAMEAFDVEKYA